MFDMNLGRLKTLDAQPSWAMQAVVCVRVTCGMLFP